MTEAIRDQLASILTNELSSYLDDGMGWQIESCGRTLQWNTTETTNSNGKITQHHATHESGLCAKVALDLDQPVSAARLQITLQNTTKHRSIAISGIKLVYLRWLDMPRQAVQARTIGGGLTQSFYPPDAYRDNTVTFRPGYGDPLRIESGPDGRSSNRDLPFAQMTFTGSQHGGLVIAFEWSGAWYQEIGFDVWRNTLTWEGGIPVNDLQLDAGEILELPAVHLIAFTGSQDAGTNACRRYVYDRICPDLDDQRPLPPTSYDHWSGIEDALDQTQALQLADRAAELGVEYFVLDDGWYADYGPAIIGIGNWQRVDKTKFPQGLKPFADHVRSKGMKFGLWFDVERAHRDSDLAQQHPEWMIDIGISKLHLNLSLQNAQDYLIDLIGGWIERLDLDWSRWDYNIGPLPYWQKIDPTGKFQFDYLNGLYRVLDTLMAKYPKWLIECCASGGRRIDLGMLRRAHTCLISDHSADRDICRFMQCGANRFLPGHLLNNNLGVRIGSGDGTTSNADILSRMCGAIQFAGDIGSWSPKLTIRVAELVRIFHEFRHLLVADFYPLTPQPVRPEEIEVVQFISRNGDDAVIMAFGTPKHDGATIVKPHGLDPTTTYTVWDPLGNGEKHTSGTALVDDGLPISLHGGAAIRRIRTTT